MRSKKNVETTKLNKGETLQKEFDNYVVMAENAVDWTLFCSYQLKRNFSEGIYKILQLPSMQIAYTNMTGGVMFDFVSPEECITFSIMKSISHKACIDQMKLERGRIAVIDDKKIYVIIRIRTNSGYLNTYIFEDMESALEFLNVIGQIINTIDITKIKG